MTPRKPWRPRIRTFGSFLLSYWVFGVAAFSLIGLRPTESYNALIAFVPVRPSDPHVLFWLHFVVTPLGMVVGLPCNIVLHELCHAGAALALGRLAYIQIGAGRTVLTMRTGPLRWLIKSAPNCGLVFYWVSSRKWARLRHACVSAAGPIGTCLVLVLLGYALLKLPSAWWMEAPGVYLCYFLGGVFASTCILLPGTLLPRTIMIDGRRAQTDMLQIFLASRIRPELIQAEVMASEALDVLRAQREELPLDGPEALRLADRYSDDARVLYALANLLRATGKRESTDCFRKALLARPGSRDERLILLDSYLTDLLDLGVVTEEPKADALSRELMELAGHSITAKGTRGSILIDIGQREQGKTLLQEVLIQTESSLDKLYSHVYLAVAEKQEGNMTAARQHAEAAQKIQSLSPVMKRVADLLEDRPDEPSASIPTARKEGF